MKSIKITILALFALALTACNVNPETPKYEKAKIIHTEEALVIKNEKGKVEGHRNAYTIFQSLDTGILYRESGVIGPVGTELSLDVANATEVK